MTRNAWLAAICVVVLVALVAENLFSEDTPPKITSFQSIYGNRISYLDPQVYWSMGHKIAYSIRIPVSEVTSAEDAEVAADRAFQDFAGPLASDMGFQRVAIKPDDGTSASQLRVFGFKFSLSIDVGAGPSKPEPDVIVYERRADGSWSRNGSSPDGPALLRKIVLPSGAVFAWTGGYEDYPFGQFIYDCLSCTNSNSTDVIAWNVFSLLKTAFVEQADVDNLKKANIAIFLGPRKSMWTFPTIFRIGLVRHADGQWLAPNLSVNAIRTMMEQYRAKMRKRGDSLRALLKA